MSAVEALAEVLRFGHWPYTIQTDDPERHGEIVCGCGWERLSDGLDDWADHLSAAVVAAIRSMPAEQKAEVVDGEVEEGVAYHDVIGCPERFHPPGSSVGWQCPHPFVEGDLARVVTPWLPLGVSPETNGEQK